MIEKQIFTNARIVLPDEVVTGSVAVEGGLIAGIDRGSASVGEDFGGDYLLAGLVELHTDHLERHFAPRPGLRWNAVAAVQAHDAQIATSGITTVFDCLRMGSEQDGFAPGEMRVLSDALDFARGQDRLRADHYVHLRCEVSSADVLEDFEQFRDNGRVRLVSLMDHAPGQRQFQTMDQYILYFKTRRGMSDADFDRFVAGRKAQSDRYSAPHRQAIAALCLEAGITLASHDDATIEHVGEAIAQHVRLAEFPTSFEAARASHEAGMSVLMGAPNVVRGGSHSGNIAARDLARAGILDVLSSDYVPFSLLHAAFHLAVHEDIVSLPEAIAMVTAAPARTVGLDDRGAIAEGRRADLIRVRYDRDVPVVLGVWRQGRRVA